VNRHYLIRTLTLTGWITALSCGPWTRADEPPLTASASDVEIAGLVRDLGDPSFAIRTRATRRLCAVGMPAAQRLRAVAASGDAETAIRAKRILSLLDRLRFTGVDVQLSLSNSAVAWDESVDLVLTFTNRSAYPARVPFMLDPNRRAELADDPRQVGDMLDAAEWVKVRGPSGREIELRVDEMASDPPVSAAVHERLEGGPVSELGPGQRMSLAVRAFNRGWARYRTQDRGAYTIVLDYVPPWEDDALAAQRVGRVISNEVTLTVTRGAPDTVSRGGAESSVDIRREGGSLIASFTNRSDLPSIVNANFGGVPPFADGRWVWELDSSRQEIPVGRVAGAAWIDFDGARLVEVPPGETIELARIDIRELRRTLSEAGAPIDGAEGEVHFAYLNLCDRAWQVRQGSSLAGNPDVPAVLRNPLPRRLMFVRQTSRPVALPEVD